MPGVFVGSEGAGAEPAGPRARVGVRTAAVAAGHRAARGRPRAGEAGAVGRARSWRRGGTAGERSPLVPRRRRHRPAGPRRQVGAAAGAAGAPGLARHRPGEPCAGAGMGKQAEPLAWPDRPNGAVAL